MTFIQRLGYYSGGLTIGIIIVIFFFAGKKSSCSYSPNSRVLKNIRIKDHYYSPETLSFLIGNKLDTNAINYVLANGKVDFGESNTQLDSCKTYTINTSKKDSLTLQMVVKNCNKQATILSLKSLK